MPGFVVFALGGGILLTAWLMRPQLAPSGPSTPVLVPVLPKVESAPSLPPPIPSPAAPAEDPKERVLSLWRKAILSKNARGVADTERALREQPALYLPSLMEMAERDSESRVRSFSTRILGKMARKDCLPLFLKQLQQDTDRYVRENAAWALGELGSPEAVEPLRQAERSDADENVRVAAAAALKKLK